jgi:hypothetical protein
VFARCGAFLKAFREEAISNTQPDRPSYAEVKSLRPTDLGWVEIRVKWRSSPQEFEVVEGRRRKMPDKVYPEYTLVY